jgi:hypothetical protein
VDVQAAVAKERLLSVEVEAVEVPVEVPVEVLAEALAEGVVGGPEAEAE